MSTVVKCRIKSYIQPFERKLAIAELSVLAGSKPKPVTAPAESALDYVISSKVSPNLLAKKLAFWEHLYGDNKILTDQVLKESTVNVVRNGIQLDKIPGLVPFGDDVPLPNRRCLRYGTHGIHSIEENFFRN